MKELENVKFEQDELEFIRIVDQNLNPFGDQYISEIFLAIQFEFDKKEEYLQKIFNYFEYSQQFKKYLMKPNQHICDIIQSKDNKIKKRVFAIRIQFTKSLKLKKVKDQIRKDIKNNYSDCTFVITQQYDQKKVDTLDLFKNFILDNSAEINKNKKNMNGK
ncbi:hypothetical protein PPERSA_04675 [Pseudocohnilembus persalinus]|uniref:Uncharacterized protein n=1 Tax=Pseudocohnilembus persalinus TaxID=266149 RepID=A0A0V0R4G2_PSEPJ|nr:hypothetical protein PPERSA_04675 [Pseudocohnilembus persalinus]|eukprot:KRX09369.1 hypothetical protein PPERSA_04675 [Pseudocohnilembus persalinus]